MAPKRSPKSPIPAPAKKGPPIPHGTPQPKGVQPQQKPVHSLPMHKPWSTSVKGGGRGR
jgi:hypothetical protein